jgi:hypothetical protein
VFARRPCLLSAGLDWTVGHLVGLKSIMVLPRALSCVGQGDQWIPTESSDLKGPKTPGRTSHHHHRVLDIYRRRGGAAAVARVQDQEKAATSSDGLQSNLFCNCGSSQ